MKKPRRNNKSIVEVSQSRTSIENKLTHAALMLGYDFEYGVDIQNRIIKLTGEVDDYMWDILDSSLNQLESTGKSTITIRINSPGGSAYSAMAIVGRIRSSKAYIVTEGFGHVMSAATLILAAGRHRRMSQYGFFMWHEASYGVDGRHSQIKNTVEHMEREERMWAKSISELSGSVKTAKWWYDNGTNKDSYFSASELMDLGVVDEVF